MADAPQISILLPVFNGAPFLRDQVQSIQHQTHTAWTVYASDDGSDDDSWNILQEFAQKWPNFSVYHGPKRGQTANTIALISHAAAELDAGSWLAFADQDDIWLPHRLSRGIDHLSGLNGPALYCASTLVADHDLSNPRRAKLHPRMPSFQNALIQNIASGNTILLNAAGADLIRQASPRAASVVAPDWWMYQMISGAGGTVIFDPEPALIYRQHSQNQFGENRSASAGRKRMRQILNGDFKTWIDGNMAALQKCEHLLTPENRAVLFQFSAMRGKGIVGRLRTLLRLGLYRQTRAGTLAIYCAALLGRL